jgi:hypothetical protein
MAEEAEMEALFVAGFAMTPTDPPAGRAFHEHDLGLPHEVVVSDRCG